MLTGNVFLTSQSISDSDGATDVTATSLTLAANNGIGSLANPIQTAVTNMQVLNAATNGIFISNTGALTLKDVSGFGQAVSNGTGRQ